MTQRTKFLLTSICSLSLCFLIFGSQMASASIWENITDKDKGGLTEIGNTVFGNEEPKNTIPEIVARIINYLFSFLGVIFLVLIIYGGFLYMTAAGDSDKISTSKDIIISASIGLAIILASYSISYFIIKNLTQAVD